MLACGFQDKLCFFSKAIEYISTLSGVTVVPRRDPLRSRAKEKDHPVRKYINISAIVPSEIESSPVDIHQSMRKPHFCAVYCAIPNSLS